MQHPGGPLLVLASTGSERTRALGIGSVRAIQRNVKTWSSGEMCLRWTATAMLEAETP
jgi:hypothetical protein